MTDGKLYVWELELIWDEPHEDIYGWCGLFSTLELAVQAAKDDKDIRFKETPKFTNTKDFPHVYESQTVNSYFYKIIKLEVDKYVKKEIDDG